MTIAPGTDVTVKIPNARVTKYDPATDRYFVYFPAFYGGAWVDARDVTPPPHSPVASADATLGDISPMFR